MKEKDLLILDQADINQKVKRIAYEILENNYDEKEIFIIGIKENGYVFGKKIFDYLKTITDQKIHLHQIALDKSNPDIKLLEYDFEPKTLKNKTVILTDDVGNTGRTLCYTLQPLLANLPKKIQVALLVDRKHKSFPICADYVGISLSTTMKEHVTVVLSKEKEEAYLS